MRPHLSNRSIKAKLAWMLLLPIAGLLFSSAAVWDTQASR